MVKNKLKIIRLLMDNQDRSFSMKQIADTLKINYKIAYEEAMMLGKLEIVQIKKQGHSNQCSFKYKLTDLTFTTEELKRESFLDNKNFKVLYTRIKEIKDPFFICLVFGSHAKGTSNKQSDLDLCVISDSKKTIQELQTIVGITTLPIHLLDFTVQQFLSMVETVKWNVGKEIVKHNIILKGIEPFYELMINVGQ